jgi:hypothetical protein
VLIKVIVQTLVLWVVLSVACIGIWRWFDRKYLSA